MFPHFGRRIRAIVIRPRSHFGSPTLSPRLALDYLSLSFDSSIKALWSGLAKRHLRPRFHPFLFACVLLFPTVRRQTKPPCHRSFLRSKAVTVHFCFSSLRSSSLSPDRQTTSRAAAPLLVPPISRLRVSFPFVHLTLTGHHHFAFTRRPSAIASQLTRILAPQVRP